MEKCASQSGILASQVMVGTLEVHNVTRTINRYGTLPKGARIGAYLESLRQSGLSQGIPPGCADTSLPPPPPPPPQDLLDSSHVAAMIRSNSTTSGFQPQSPLLARLSPRIHVPRGDRRAKDPTLADLEFPPPPTDLPPPEEDTGGEDQQTSSSLFDLPPPPFGERGYQAPPSKMGPSQLPRSPRTRRKEKGCSEGAPDSAPFLTRSPAPQRASFSITRKKLREADLTRPPLRAKPQLDSSEGEGAEAGAAPLRFGVSLRHRDQSSDSCESGRSGDNCPLPPPPPPLGGGLVAPLPRRQSQLTSHSKSPETSSVDTEGGPRTPSSAAGEAGQTSPSPSSLEAHRPSFEEASHSSSKEDSLDDPPPAVEPSPPPPNNNNNNKKDSPHEEGEGGLGVRKRSPSNPPPPQTKLVSELFESFRRPKSARANGTPEAPPAVTTKPISNSSFARGGGGRKPPDEPDPPEDRGITFIPKLRKTERPPKPEEGPPGESDPVSNLVDFRAQLRKTNGPKEGPDLSSPPPAENSVVKSPSAAKEEPATPPTDGEGEESKGGGPPPQDEEAGEEEEKKEEEEEEEEEEEDEVKRFSSSSISSLKKLWENKDEEKLGGGKAPPDAAVAPPQTSPKYGSNTLLRRLKGLKGDQAETLKEEVKASPSPPEEDNNKGGPRPDHRRVWPPPTPTPTPTPSKAEDLTPPPPPARPTSEGGKPSVPTKPLVKNFRPPPPSVGVKLPPPRPAGIYAIPSFVRPSPPVTLLKKEAPSKSSEPPPPCLPKPPSEKSLILEGGTEVEDALASVRKDLTSSSSYSRLSSRIASFQRLCDRYVDNVPPQGRFRMRELLSQLERQAHQLRSSGNKPPAQPDSLFAQVETTVQEISSTVRR